MAFNQGEDTSIEEDTCIEDVKPARRHPFGHDAWEIEKEAHAVEREARAVEREARAVEREARALEDEVLRRERPLYPSLSDLLTAADVVVALCRELLDYNPPDWNQHVFVKALENQLRANADEIRATASAAEVPPPNDADGGSPEPPPAKT